MSVRKSCSGLRSEPPANNNHSPHFHDKETQKDQVRKRTKTLYAHVKWKILHLLPLLTLCCSVWEPCLCGFSEMLDCVWLCPLGSLRWLCVALCGSVWSFGPPLVALCGSVWRCVALCGGQTVGGDRWQCPVQTVPQCIFKPEPTPWISFCLSHTEKSTQLQIHRNVHLNIDTTISQSSRLFAREANDT